MNIAVYCSSASDLPAAWTDAAAEVGRWIGRHGASLVYGGVDAGLMRVTAEACKRAGGTIVGVVSSRRIPMASPLNDVKVPASDLNDRKGVMQLLADAFVVLPGGYGTLDEFSTSFSYINFTRRRDKRIILHNPDGLYDHLLAQLHAMVDRGLMSPDALDILDVTDTVAALVAALDRFFQSHTRLPK
ncbi:MAG: TIGR00730 family Rossman fold protein [Bacteroidales bacterium]|nr:TIGR00730 family Rossman fold protein [Bacteroidales bacterium]